jgi:hypothetical protein
VAEQESAPSGIDTRIPNMARMYDYALGGEDNFAADRAAVEQLFSFSPENRYVNGFNLVEPGLTAVTQWRGNELDRKLDAAGQWWLGGVGAKE